MNITINRPNAVPVSHSAGATVATAVASNGVAPYIYSLATGFDNFNINSITGIVTTKEVMNIANIASFTVTVTDSASTPVSVTSKEVYPKIQAIIKNRYWSENIIHKITNDYDLGHGILVLPANCTLDFQGGSFFNGTIVGSNTKVLTVGNPFNDTIIVLGTIYDINGINILAITKGTTDQRPVDTIISEGFQYYDSTLKKMILWNGTTWTNLDGSALA